MVRKLRLLGQAAAVACVLSGWTAAGTAGAQSACSDLGGTVDASQICQVQSAGTSYKIHFRFPVDYPDQQSVADYLTQQRDGFIKFSQLPLAQTFGRPYELVSTATTYRSATSGSESLVLLMGQDAQPHPVAWYQAFNYNLSTHTPITFDTLFKSGTDPLAVLNPMLKRKFGPLPLGDPGAEVYKNFALTDDAVIFFFNQGQVLGHESGKQRMSVPRSDLASLLA
jgi:hypothetical protein